MGGTDFFSFHATLMGVPCTRSYAIKLEQVEEKAKNRAL